MCNLKELYLSYNEISDLSPLSMLDQLEILDLEGYVFFYAVKEKKIDKSVPPVTISHQVT